MELSAEYDDYDLIDIDDDSEEDFEDTGLDIFEDIEMANQAAAGF